MVLRRANTVTGASTPVIRSYSSSSASPSPPLRKLSAPPSPKMTETSHKSLPEDLKRSRGGTNPQQRKTSSLGRGRTLKWFPNDLDLTNEGSGGMGIQADDEHDEGPRLLWIRGILLVIAIVFIMSMASSGGESSWAKEQSAKTRETITITQEPVTITQEPVTITREPVTITQEPSTVTREPVAQASGHGKSCIINVF